MFNWLFGNKHKEMAEVLYHLRTENSKLHADKRNDRKLIDDLISKENESKAIYDCMAKEFEAKNQALQEEVDTLKDQIRELKSFNRKRKKDE